MSSPMAPDPITAALNRHRRAWEAYQVAPEGHHSRAWAYEMSDALDEVLDTPCATLAGCFALVEHLRWFIAEEAVNYAAENGRDWQRVVAREAELSMLLGSKLSSKRPPATTINGAPSDG